MSRLAVSSKASDAQIIKCWLVSTAKVYVGRHAEAEAGQHCPCEIHCWGCNGRQATHQHYFGSLALSKYACPDQSLPEASIDIIPGTGFGIHVDGGDPFFQPRAAAPMMGPLDLTGESVSGQVLGPGHTALKDSPALLEFQSNYDLRHRDCEKDIFNLRQEENAASLQHRHRPSSRTVVQC